MQIRIATKEDAERIAELIRPMWLLHADHEPDFLNKEYLAGLDIAAYVDGSFHDDNECFIVADKAGVVIGCCKGEIRKDDEMFNTENLLYLDDLAVDEAYQRQGIAEAFLNWFTDFAKERGVSILKARIYGFNTSAQRLFEKLDFKPMYTEQFKKI